MGSKPFYDQPILNSPYYPPTLHHAFDERGQPLDQPPITVRRRSRYVLPVPPSRRRQPELDFGTYTDNDVINEIRGHVTAWRAMPTPADWGVTPVTQRLLRHWRHHEFADARPFFCQLEAVETIIWLTEVAPRNKRLYGALLRGLVLGVASIPTFGIGLATLAWTALMDARRQRRGWHDQVAKTVVVRG